MSDPNVLRNMMKSRQGAAMSGKNKASILKEKRKAGELVPAPVSRPNPQQHVPQPAVVRVPVGTAKVRQISVSALSAPVARSQPLVDTMPPPAPQAGVALMAQYDSESDDDNVEAPTPAPVVPAVPAQSLPADFFDRVNSNPTTSKSSSTAATSKIASKIPVGFFDDPVADLQTRASTATTVDATDGGVAKVSYHKALTQMEEQQDMEDKLIEDNVMSQFFGELKKDEVSMQQDGDQEDRDLLDLDNIEDQVEDTSGSALTVEEASDQQARLQRQQQRVDQAIEHQLLEEEAVQFQYMLKLATLMKKSDATLADRETLKADAVSESDELTNYMSIPNSNDVSDMTSNRSNSTSASKPVDASANSSIEQMMMSKKSKRSRQSHTSTNTNTSNSSWLSRSMY